jgi:hypothetical protein
MDLAHGHFGLHTSLRSCMIVVIFSNGSIALYMDSLRVISIDIMMDNVGADGKISVVGKKWSVVYFCLF